MTYLYLIYLWPAILSNVKMVDREQEEKSTSVKTSNEPLLLLGALLTPPIDRMDAVQGYLLIRTTEGIFAVCGKTQRGRSKVLSWRL